MDAEGRQRLGGESRQLASLRPELHGQLLLQLGGGLGLDAQDRLRTCIRFSDDLHVGLRDVGVIPIRSEVHDVRVLAAERDGPADESLEGVLDDPELLLRRVPDRHLVVRAGVVAHVVDGLAAHDPEVALARDRAPQILKPPADHLGIAARLEELVRKGIGDDDLERSVRQDGVEALLEGRGGAAHRAGIEHRRVDVEMLRNAVRARRPEGGRRQRGLGQGLGRGGDGAAPRAGLAGSTPRTRIGLPSSRIWRSSAPGAGDGGLPSRSVMRTRTVRTLTSTRSTKGLSCAVWAGAPFTRSARAAAAAATRDRRFDMARSLAEDAEVYVVSARLQKLRSTESTSES